ncbi:MAG: hypothetical protein KC620_09655, partial [Myxococcales bacterium]|nr:hypothetical protein [Myxococcales bacterium]
MIVRRVVPLVALALSLGCTDDAGVGGPNGPDARPPAVDADLPPLVDVQVRDMRVDLDDFGEECDDNAQCLAQLCTERPEGGQVCTRRCRVNDDCPAGWECRPLANDGPDTTLYCLADANDLCKPCESHLECDDSGDLCLHIGNGFYCGENCADDGRCPPSFECATLTVRISGEDREVQQCIPADGAGCATCVDADNDGYGDGEDCLGFDCADDDPTIYEGAPELCDGKDNNCNAQTDERAQLVDAPVDFGCLDTGVCAGAPVVCREGAWSCDYPGSYDPGDEVRCDGSDNDCDGRVDESFDHQTDPQHCGVCNNACSYDHAAPLCVDGRCALGDCEPGWHNADGNAGNGCEYGPCQLSNMGLEQCDGIDNDCDAAVDEELRVACGMDVGQCRSGFQGCIDGRLADCEGAIGPQPEVCDGLDNDCDGQPDEDFGILSDVNNCGRCGFVCDLAEASARCSQGACLIDNCNPGFWDNNGNDADGCEYACTLSNQGVEACDQVDNDCDGAIDEGIDLESDPLNCGGCGRRCAYEHASGRCDARQCSLGMCNPGFHDIDGNPANGCEYECQPSAEEDLPDPGFVDADCDGLDGEIEDAIFVAPRGNDVNAGTLAAPVATIARAMDLALGSDPPKYIIAAEGVYEGTVTLRAGVRIYGGYRPGPRWARSADYETIIRGGARGVIADGLAGPASLTRVTIESTTPNQAGASSYGLWVRNSGDLLTLDACKVRAGDGAAGNGGGNGDVGGPGQGGGTGDSGCDGGLLGTGGCNAR